MAYAAFERHPTEWEGWTQVFVTGSGPGVYVADDSGAQVWFTETRHTTTRHGTTTDTATVVAMLTVRATPESVGGPRRVVDTHTHQHALSAARPLIERYNAGEYDQTIPQSTSPSSPS